MRGVKSPRQRPLHDSSKSSVEFFPPSPKGSEREGVGGGDAPSSPHSRDNGYISNSATLVQADYSKAAKDALNDSNADHTASHSVSPVVGAAANHLPTPHEGGYDAEKRGMPNTVEGGGSQPVEGRGTELDMVALTSASDVLSCTESEWPMAVQLSVDTAPDWFHGRERGVNSGDRHAQARGERSPGHRPEVADSSLLACGVGMVASPHSPQRFQQAISTSKVRPPVPVLTPPSRRRHAQADHSSAAHPQTLEMEMARRRSTTSMAGQISPKSTARSGNSGRGWDRAHHRRSLISLESGSGTIELASPVVSWSTSRGAAKAKARNMGGGTSGQHQLEGDGQGGMGPGMGPGMFTFSVDASPSPIVDDPAGAVSDTREVMPRGAGRYRTAKPPHLSTSCRPALHTVTMSPERLPCTAVEPIRVSRARLAALRSISPEPQLPPRSQRTQSTLTTASYASLSRRRPKESLTGHRRAGVGDGRVSEQVRVTRRAAPASGRSCGRAAGGCLLRRPTTHPEIQHRLRIVQQRARIVDTGDAPAQNRQQPQDAQRGRQRERRTWHIQDEVEAPRAGHEDVPSVPAGPARRLLSATNADTSQPSDSLNLPRPLPSAVVADIPSQGDGEGKGRIEDVNATRLRQFMPAVLGRHRRFSCYSAMQSHTALAAAFARSETRPGDVIDGDIITQPSLLGTSLLDAASAEGSVTGLSPVRSDVVLAGRMLASALAAVMIQRYLRTPSRQVGPIRSGSQTVPGALEQWRALQQLVHRHKRLGETVHSSVVSALDHHQSVPDIAAGAMNQTHTAVAVLEMARVVARYGTGWQSFGYPVPVSAGFAPRDLSQLGPVALIDLAAPNTEPDASRQTPNHHTQGDSDTAHPKTPKLHHNDRGGDDAHTLSRQGDVTAPVPAPAPVPVPSSTPVRARLSRDKIDRQDPNWLRTPAAGLDDASWLVPGPSPTGSAVGTSSYTSLRSLPGSSVCVAARRNSAIVSLTSSWEPASRYSPMSIHAARLLATGGSLLAPTAYTSGGGAGTGDARGRLAGESIWSLPGMLASVFGTTTPQAAGRKHGQVTGVAAPAPRVRLVGSMYVYERSARSAVRLVGDSKARCDSGPVHVGLDATSSYFGLRP